MTRTSRLWLAFGLLCLVGLFFFPLWKISLEAPQYPEPLGMRIWLYKITGISPHDIQNINLLNHYIGMKEIHAHSIPELRWMPWIVGFLIALGLACFAFLRPWLLILWLALASILGSLGLLDFYLWQYDYGHDLNPDAPIKIPGMSYQPPFLGSKQLLNITAHSYPDISGFLFGFAFLAFLLALWFCKRTPSLPPSSSALPPSPPSSALPPSSSEARLSLHAATPPSGGQGVSNRISVVRRAKPFTFLFLLLPLTLAACTPRPQPIVLHKDTCHRCQMMIADGRFGAEIVTPKGRAYKYDSIECLVAATLENPKRPIHSLWVTDFLTPGRLIAAPSAFFFYHPSLPSPMGLNLHAFASDADRSAFRKTHGGALLTWKALASFVGHRWAIPTSAPASKPTSRASLSSPASPSPTAAAHSLTERLRQARPFDTLLLQPGFYDISNLRITKPIVLRGQPGVIFDSSRHSQGDILVVEADHVRISGITFQNVSPSFLHDRAAIRIKNSKACHLQNNTFLGTFFGIYLENAEGCTLQGNLLQGRIRKESHAGNGIHLWKSRAIRILSNRVSSHRDGIYLEFAEDCFVSHNLTSKNLRYGLHFMFSHNNEYTANTFENNGAGVAVMFTRNVRMHGNAFLRNWGSAAYGLLLKDITDSQISDNCFLANTTGLFAEGSNRLTVQRNLFDKNGYALKLLSNTTDTSFQENHFLANTFDVSSNPTDNHSNRFAQNYWSQYQGYDLDRDGWGDIPYYPVRLFSVWVDQQPASLIFLRSFFVQILDTAERIMPALTPPLLVDRKPRYRPDPSISSLCRSLT